MSAAEFQSGLQHPRSRAPITHQKLLLVEGVTPFYFFLGLLRHLRFEDLIEIRNFGGIADFHDAIRLLVATPGFANVTSVGIVRDAEIDARASFDSVCSGLRAARLSVPVTVAVSVSGPPSTSVFILPDCASPGTLETLCLQALESDSATPCIEQYFDCLEQANVHLGNMPKAKVQAFLSSRERSGLLLGQAAQAGFIPWGEAVFDELKGFLTRL